MTMRRVQIGSSVLLAAVVAFGAVAQAADQTVIYLARAIGEEAPPPETQTTPKTAPAKKAPSPVQKPVAAAKPAATPGPKPQASKGISKTAIWVGVGVAALLAAAAGAGGSSAAVSHIP
jgi:hypothetical protein